MDWIILIVDPTQVNFDDLDRLKDIKKVIIVRVRKTAYGKHAPIQAVSAQGSREMTLDDLRNVLFGLNEGNHLEQASLTTRTPDDPTDAPPVNDPEAV